MRTTALLLLLLAFMPSVFAQSRTFQIKDAENGDAIPYASVVLGPGKGTISNGEGYFSVDLNQLKGIGFKISCMGYRSLEVSPDTLDALPDILTLKPAAINLNEVRVGGGIPTADQIISRVRNNLDSNYGAVTENAYQVFYRESEYMQFEDLVLELEKASDLSRKDLKAADARLRKLGEDIVKSNPRNFMDFKGIWKKTSDTSSVMKVERATQLIDHNKDYSMENIEERAKGIVMEHLDSTKTYKVKTGIFKIEDEMSPVVEFNDAEDESDSIKVSYLKDKTGGLTKMASWQEGTRLRNFLDPELYKYTFLEATYFDGYYVYAIGFEPRKRKAKYSGTLYVETNSDGVLKTDYAYAKGRRGSKVNLRLILGVKYVENLSRGTVIFKRNEENKFFPYYAEKEYGNYIYLHRDLKFIENSPERKKVRFDFLLEGGVRERETMLAQPAAPAEIASLEAGPSPEKIELIHLERYEPTIWQDSEIIEPLEEMKNFTVEQR